MDSNEFRLFDAMRGSLARIENELARIADALELSIPADVQAKIQYDAEMRAISKEMKEQRNAALPPLPDDEPPPF